MSRTPRRARQASPAGPPANPTICGCPNRQPTLIGHFRDGDLVNLYRWHHPLLCGQPNTLVNITQWRNSR